MKLNDKVAKNYANLIAAMNNPIDINRNDTKRRVVMILKGVKNNALEVNVLVCKTLTAIKNKDAFILKRKKGEVLIDIQYDEMHVVHLNDEDTVNSYKTKGGMKLRLYDDKVLLVDGDVIKSWNKMKSMLS